jgi:hypothetical protein
MMFDTIINSIHEFFVKKSGIKRQINGLVGLWYLTPLSTIFQLYRGSQFY